MAALFLIASLLVLLSLAIARFFEGFGVPSLLLFLAIGMLAGREGANILSLSDPSLVQGIGVFALIVILYSGGLGTHWPSVRPHWRQALSLSTLGVLATAGLVGAFTHYCLGFPWLQGLLLGSIISSTDAAAVFASLRSRNLDLKPGIRHLLELESGSNDPMAVFLTVSLIHLSLHPSEAWWPLLPDLLWQAGVGLLVGWALGRAAVFVANHARFATEGFTMVFFLAAGVFTYGLAETLGGSGFLAVYLSAIACGNRSFVQKKSVARFYDGLSWLAQIGMFLSLGLLVQPSALLPVLSQGLLVTAFLIFAARPIAVWLCLAPVGMRWRETAYVGWVGLRGAVPIVLATYLLVKDSSGGILAGAPWLFNLVFFIVLGSALLQGWSVSQAARLLKVGSPTEKPKPKPLELTSQAGGDKDLEEFIVPFNSMAAGRSIAQLDLPDQSLVVLLGRNGEFLEPSGASVLEEGDTLMALVNPQTRSRLQALLAKQKPPGAKPGGDDEPSHWFG